MAVANVCRIHDTVRNALKQFRTNRSETNRALVMKVEMGKREVIIETMLEGVSLTEMQEHLPSHQPRYMVYSFRMKHSDGRISYPMCFIFITPRDSKTELQVLYAASKMAVQSIADLARVYEVRGVEELTDEWLHEKLNK